MRIKLTQIQLRKLLEEAVSNEVIQSYTDTPRGLNVGMLLNRVFSSLENNETYIKELENKNPDRLYFNIPEEYYKEKIKEDKENNQERKSLLEIINKILMIIYPKRNENKDEFEELFDKGLVKINFKTEKGSEKTQERKLIQFLENNKEIIDKNNFKTDDIIKRLLRYYTKYGKNDSNDFILVISRDKKDITLMSADRNWVSCMHCESGGHKEKIKDDIQYGTLIAYVIYSNDLEIKKPLGRVLIKPFIKDENNYLDVYYKAENKVYGVTGENILNLEYVNNLFNDYNSDKTNFPYDKHPKLYNDDQNSIITKYGPFNEKKLIELSNNDDEFNNCVNDWIFNNTFPHEYIPPIEIIDKINRNNNYSKSETYGFKQILNYYNEGYYAVFESRIIDILNKYPSENMLDILINNNIIKYEIPVTNNFLEKIISIKPDFIKDLIDKLDDNGKKKLANKTAIQNFLINIILNNNSLLKIFSYLKIIGYLNNYGIYNIISEITSKEGLGSNKVPIIFCYYYNNNVEPSNIFYVLSDISDYVDIIKILDNCPQFLEFAKNNKEKIIGYFPNNKNLINLLKDSNIYNKDLDEQEETSTASGGGKYPEVNSWSKDVGSKLTRGPANPIGNGKREDKIVRGPANYLK